MKNLFASTIGGLVLFFATNAFADVYELRTYTAMPGRLPDVVQRFNDHTRKYFDKYNIKSVGYWIPRDKPNTLIYIVAHTSKEEAAINWAAFAADTGWQAVRTASMANGPIVEKTESIYMDPTSFSDLK